MQITIAIQMDNDAFGETESSRLHEVRRILAEYFGKKDGKIDTRTFHYGAGKIMDVNGNSVGKWEIFE